MNPVKNDYGIGKIFIFIDVCIPDSIAVSFKYKTKKLVILTEHQIDWESFVTICKNIQKTNPQLDLRADFEIKTVNINIAQEF